MLQHIETDVHKSNVAEVDVWSKFREWYKTDADVVYLSGDGNSVVITGNDMAQVLVVHGKWYRT